MFATAARRLPARARRNLLAYAGPVLISLTIATWVLLLVTGWALIFHPALGTGIVAAKGATDTGFSTALYFSGFTITTLGTGDVVPVSPVYRALTVAEAAVGFSVLTMVLTYFLSIYGSITARKTFASSLHHHTFDTGTPVQFVLGISRVDDISRGSEHLSQLARFLTHTAETHRSYPVLRYFHFRDDRYALPRLLLLALDTVTLLRSALDDRRYEALLRSPVVFELHATGLELLNELVPEAKTTGTALQRQREWAQRFSDNVDLLRTGGLTVVADVRAGSEAYVALREGWDRPLRALAGAMVYEWDHVEGATW